MVKVPVVSSQSGWDTLPKVGVGGTEGAEFTVALLELFELQPPDIVATTV
jgi:hypothetical protein